MKNGNSTGSPNIIDTVSSKMTFSDGILFVEIKEGAVLDKKSIDEQTRAREELVGMSTFAVLIDARNKHKVTTEARNPKIDLDEENRLGIAIVTSNQVTRFAANFFFQIKKPKVPHKMFSDIDKALRWLGELKRAHERTKEIA